MQDPQREVDRVLLYSICQDPLTGRWQVASTKEVEAHKDTEHDVPILAEFPTMMDAMKDALIRHMKDTGEEIPDDINFLGA